MPAFLIAAVIAFLGGSTSFAAENALPGDALYGMKTEVNERVVAAFSFGEEAKTEWEARRAERRLEEVAELASEGKLKTDVGARVEENFKAHADRVDARIEELKAAGDTEKAAALASRFESSLRAHDRILERLKERADEDGDEEESEALSSVAQTNTDALNSAETDRTETEQSLEDGDGDEDEDADEKAGRKESAEGKIGAAENVLASATRYVEQKKTDASAESVKAAAEGLKKAAELIAQAKSKVTDGEYGEAFVLANKAIRAAQEAKTLLERSDALNIEVKARVSNDADDDADNEEKDGDKDEDEGKTDERRPEARVRVETKDRDEREND